MRFSAKDQYLQTLEATHRTGLLGEDIPTLPLRSRSTQTPTAVADRIHSRYFSVYRLSTSAGACHLRIRPQYRSKLNPLAARLQGGRPVHSAFPVPICHRRREKQQTSPVPSESPDSGLQKLPCCADESIGSGSSRAAIQPGCRQLSHHLR